MPKEISLHTVHTVHTKMLHRRHWRTGSEVLPSIFA